MQFITEADFNEVLAKDKYYQNRWGYFKQVIDMIGDFEGRVLEIGVHKLPIFKDSETMDIVKNYEGLTYQRDATILPYHFEDKEFDLLVSLQCLEHLHPHQKAVFEEWSRIAKVIVISLPYMWHCPDDIMHHHIDLPLIEEWTGKKPTMSIIKDCRVILKYE